jgi:hypothetical protein
VPFHQPQADAACNFFEHVLKHTADEWFGNPREILKSSWCALWDGSQVPTWPTLSPLYESRTIRQGMTVAGRKRVIRPKLRNAIADDK